MIVQSQPKYLVNDSIIGRYEPNLYAIDIPYDQVIEVYISQNVFLYIFSNFISENEGFL